MRQTQLNLESIHELGVAALSVIFLSTSAPSAYFKAEGKLENSYGWSKIPHHIGLSWIISDKLKLMNNQVSPPSNNQSENELLLQPPKNQSKIVLVLTTLLIVAVGVAIALGYQLFTQNQKIGLQPSTPTTPPAPTTLSPTASAPDSRTYTDPKNRFSFSYPQSWQVNDKSSSNQDPQLTFTNISEGHTINISVWRVTGFGYCYIYGEKQTIVVGTKNAETADGVGPSEMCDKPEEYANRGNTYVLIPLEDTTDGLPLNQLHISYDYPLSDKSIAKSYLNQILSSVKLTSDLATATEVTKGWLKYTHQKFPDKPNWEIPWKGFTIYYPSTWKLTENKDTSAPSLNLNLTKSNGDYFEIIQAAGGGGYCLFPDQPEYATFDGMATKYPKYTEINKGNGVVWRLADWPTPGDMWSHQLCESFSSDMFKNGFVSTTGIGFTKIKVTNPESLNELREILKNIEISN